jgi:hypothetical protein
MSRHRAIKPAYVWGSLNNTEPPEDDDEVIDYYAPADTYVPRSDFADPHGVSALRAATPSNPRNLPCPTCGEPNRLTPHDRQLGYQCDQCADQVEGGY